MTEVGKTGWIDITVDDAEGLRAGCALPGAMNHVS
jgi:hypothetical protein